MKAISLRQPWLWAILHAQKSIENRRWNTSYRGPILLHAAKGCTVNEFVEAVDWMLAAGVIHGGNDVPGLERMQRGGIVGRARLVGVIPPGRSGLFVDLEADLRWHMIDQYGFVLADVEPLPFRPCKGALGLFEVAP